MRIGKLLVFVATALSLIIGTAAAAQAQTTASAKVVPLVSLSPGAVGPNVQDLGPFWIHDHHTGMCLDSNWGTNGVGSVYTHSCNGGAWQTWEEFYTGGYYTDSREFVNWATGYCLDGNGFPGASSGQIYTHPCNGGAYQSWELDWAAASTFHLISDGTSLYLDSNYGSNGVGSVYALPGNGGDWQEWVFAACGNCT